MCVWDRWCVCGEGWYREGVYVVWNRGIVCVCVFMCVADPISQMLCHTAQCGVIHSYIACLVHSHMLRLPSTPPLPSPPLLPQLSSLSRTNVFLTLPYLPHSPPLPLPHPLPLPSLPPRAPLITRLFPHMMGGPFYTSVPSGRVGLSKVRGTVLCCAVLCALLHRTVLCCAVLCNSNGDGDRI